MLKKPFINKSHEAEPNATRRKNFFDAVEKTFALQSLNTFCANSGCIHFNTHVICCAFFKFKFSPKTPNSFLSHSKNQKSIFSDHLKSYLSPFRLKPLRNGMCARPLKAQCFATNWTLAVLLDLLGNPAVFVHMQFTLSCEEISDSRLGVPYTCFWLMKIFGLIGFFRCSFRGDILWGGVLVKKILGNDFG